MSTRTKHPSNTKAVFRPHERVWLCLTTLHHRRFVEDAIHVVGLPYGSRIRLRYREQYIDPALWCEVSLGQGRPSDTVALVALAATTTDGSNVVLPLREGRITSARCEGSVLIIDITLRNFVFEALPPGTFWDELQLIANGLPKAFGSRFETGGAYLQALPSAPQAISASDSIAAWETVADAFFRIDIAGAVDTANHFPCTPFLYHIHKLPRRLTRSLVNGGAVELEAGESVVLEVHTVVGPTTGAFRNPLGEILFELSHPAASFTSTRRVRVDSRRDVRTIGISTVALFRTAKGHLSLRTVVFDDDGGADAGAASVHQRMLPSKNRDEAVVARYDFPLHVGRWMPWLASGLVASAAALAAYKSPAEGKTADLLIYLVPACVFVFAFAGLVMGLRREGKG